MRVMRGLSLKQQVLLFSLVTTALMAGCFVQRRAEKRNALQTHLQLMELLVEGNTEQAYRLTTNDYRANNSLQQFQTKYAHIQGEPAYLTKTPMVLSCSFGSAEIYFRDDPGWFEFLNGPTFYYKKEQGQWRFTGAGAHYMD